MQCLTTSKHLVRPNEATISIAATYETGFGNSLAICSAGAAFALCSLRQRMIIITLYEKHGCILTVPETLPPAAVQIFPLGFKAPFGMRQPKMRGAAIAPVAQRNTRRVLRCIVYLVRKATWRLVMRLIGSSTLFLSAYASLSLYIVRALMRH